MKLLYAFLADASNESNGKVNALGLGLRVVNASKLPALVPLALVGCIEVRRSELGEHQFKVEWSAPKGPVRTIVDDTVNITDRPDHEAKLPVEFRFNVSFPMLIAAPGRHTLRVQFGKLRLRYAVLVRQNEADAATSN
jgi:hypothetical protein